MRLSPAYRVVTAPARITKLPAITKVLHIRDFSFSLPLSLFSGAAGPAAHQ